MGRVLGKILADFLGIKNQGEASVSIDIVHESLQSELDLNLDEMLSWPKDGFVQKLVDERKFSEAHLEILADIFYSIQHDITETKKQKLLERTFLIYQYLDSKGASYSFTRHERLIKLKMFLN